MQNCQIRLMCKYNAIIRHVNGRTSNFSVLIASTTVTLNFVGKHKTTPIARSSNFDGSKNVMVALEKRIFRTNVKWWEKRALNEQFFTKIDLETVYDVAFISNGYKIVMLGIHNWKSQVLYSKENRQMSTGVGQLP